jgi:hypothetical protein
VNIRQAAVPVAVAVLLCLVPYFPLGTTDASAGEASFMVTEQSLDNLRKEGLPNDILRKLESLKDKKFNTEGEFLEAVRQKIGNDQTVSYKKQFLHHAADDIAEIKRISGMLQAQNRAIESLQAQNRALAKRLAELEAARDEHAQKQAKAESGEQKELEQRVKELEDTQTAREDATRSIIRNALSTLGSKINEYVSLGGTLEVTGGWTKDFSRQSEGQLALSTAELDFEIEANKWAKGSLVLQFVESTNATFPTTTGFQTGGDRITIDTADITVGDPQRFPPFLTAGRIVLPFGISTGNPVTDVLTIEDPLTIEGFEMKQTAVGIGLGFPTPAAAPATPPVTPPPVRPLVINPLISSLSRALGYKFPPPAPLTPIIPKPAPPLFNVGIYTFNGNTFEGGEKRGGFRPENYIDATAGFHIRGNCGRPYDQLRGTVFCPWIIDVDVDYNSSIFDSQFLGFEYEGFLGQIGFIDGVAASIKATLGPVSLIGEWNGAIRRAKFIDDAGKSVGIKPSAWQVSLGYQFDWNPWVEAIGTQGDYLALTYSQSSDLAGVTQVIDGQPNRVGFLPRRRLVVGVGEWVLDNLRFAIEYSHNWDYPKSEGGTGNTADGILSQLTLVW